ncbi:hypothetical protein Pcinc_016971 [Petrolisthes cinctipes]|uniref:Major facilitator superfamily (MFS) profile domain-containing protein n=1 Tax=Petrolisthes cinctipes TaxID=88211 RepID=A0AAE1FSF8_PETCI|nr:hypothetical protein Pcinc_016971 [Petrolisthes cinctipes]
MVNVAINLTKGFDIPSYHNLETKLVKCVNGWEYDHSQYTSTVATSFDWVCDKEHYSSLLLSTYMIGNTVGTFLLSILADKVLGRRLVFYLSLVIHVVFTIAVTLVSTFPLHLALRFLAGIAFQSYYLMPYIICEYDL